MFERGMTMEQVEEMVEAMGWEILQRYTCAADGNEWVEMTVLQENHAVALGLDEDGIYEIQFVPLWAL